MTIMEKKLLLLCSLIGIIAVQSVDCLQKRCLKCRSRGELGTCGDPFPFNQTDPEAEIGVHAVACPSGWCAKTIEGSTGSYKADDYGAATERSCMQRPPSDYEERCAYTLIKYKKVYVCFCTGDLCNSAFRISTSTILVSSIFVVLYNALL